MRMDVKLSLLFLLFLRFSDVLYGKDESYECSGYYFKEDGRAMHENWKEANESCDKEQAVLASIESDEEWKHLRNITKSKTRRWYIGLKYFSSSEEWCWLSSLHACLNETLSIPDNGTWRWNKGEPNHLKTEHCVEMFANGEFNNIKCDNSFHTRGDGPGGYICEKEVDCDNLPRDLYVFKFKKTTLEPLPTTKEDSSGPVTRTQESSVQPNTPTLETPLPVSHPTDDSNRGNQSSSITVIVVAVLAAFLVILLVVLGGVLLRRRSCSSKEREDQRDSHVTDGIRLESAPEQTPQEQAQPLQNDAPLREDKKEDNPDDYEQVCVTSNSPSEPFLERKDHIYAGANAKQADRKHKPPVYPTPYAVAQKRPTENADDTSGKEQYLYAAVDKTRKRGRKDEPSTCGPVYAELGFNPSQDEDKTEMTTQDSFTVYASIQEGQ